jgi:exodeoxyribonuclease VII small subunit
MAKKDVEPAQPPAFESALGELEKLVEKMERGDVSLEESLRMFERGVELARHCQTALRDAENKIQVLMEKNGQQVLDDLVSDEPQD